MIAGLKKLYAFLDEYGYKEEEGMKGFWRMVRDNRQEWKEAASGSGNL
jgi:hypothetical protein